MTVPDKLKARVYPPLEPCHLLGMHRQVHPICFVEI